MEDEGERRECVLIEMDSKSSFCTSFFHCFLLRLLPPIRDSSWHGSLHAFWLQQHVRHTNCFGPGIASSSYIKGLRGGS
eukprot:jgi/Botrbrau1/7253/Bobra.0021s0035.1